MTLAPDQIRRYARHVLLPDIGGVGQARLLGSRVRVTIDGPAAEIAVVYLAAAGVGALALDAPDGDRAIDAAGIRDGIAYVATDRDRSRREALADRVRALNPDCTIVAADRDDTILSMPALALPPIDGSTVADALIRGGLAACTLLHALATTA